MTQAVTFDDVWKLFQEVVLENRERSAETERKFQEAAREAREAAREAREAREADRKAMEREAADRAIREAADRAIREAADRKAREADRAIREEANRRLWEEADRRFRETERMIRESSAETDRKIKEVSQQIGNLGSRWGEFVEGIVAPACETLFATRNISVREVHRRVKAKLPGNRHMEIDLLAVDGGTVVPVEVKSRLRAEDVRDFLKRLEEFKEFLPRYADARVLGAVAGIIIEEGVDRYAMNEGLFVIAQSGKSVKLANSGEFEPRAW